MIVTVTGIAVTEVICTSELAVGDERNWTEDEDGVELSWTELFSVNTPFFVSFTILLDTFFGHTQTETELGKVRK